MAAVEQLSVIRAALDPTGYTTGAQAIQRANAEIGRSQATVQAGAQTTTRAMESAERAFVKTARGADQVAKELLAFQRAQETATRAVTLGVATQDQAAAVLAGYRARVDAAVVAKQRLTGATVQATNALGVTRTQMQQLAPQINDVATSLLGGASAFQVLTQQGGQITQVFGGVGNTFRALAGLFTPARVAVAGFTVAIGASVAAYETTERRLAALRRELRGTSADYAAFAQQLDRNARGLSASLPGATLSETRMVQGRVATLVPTDMRGDIDGITRLVVDLSRSLDSDLTSALERVTRAMRDPEQAVRDLAERGIRGFNEEFRRHIELLVAGGQSYQAFREIMDRLRGTFGDAQRDVSDLERAWQNVRKGWESFSGSIIERLEQIGGPLIRALSDAATGADRAGQMFATMGRAVQGAINPLGALVDILGGPVLRALEAVGRTGATAFSWLDRVTNSPLMGFLNPLGALGVLSRSTPVTERPPAGGVAPVASANLPPEARAFLDAIAGPESGGRYNVRWGGPQGPQTFDDFSRHPNILAPGPHGPSSAAGRYQFTGSTWGPLASRYGVSDFSPESQDLVAWRWAQDEYRQQTGGDLLTDLRNPERFGAIQGVMSRPSMWTTFNAGRLPGAMAAQGGGSSSWGAAPAAASATGSAQSRESDRLAREAAGGRTAQDDLSRARISGFEAERNRITSGAEGRELTAEETARVAALTEAIERETAAINGRETATQRSIRTGRDNLRVLQTEDDLRREIAREVTSAREAARGEGRTLSIGEEQAIERRVRAEAAAQREDQIRTNDRLIQSERAVAQAYLFGARSGIEAAARQQAINDARRTTVTGTAEWRAEVERLTQQYLRLGLARAEGQVAQQLVQQEQTLALLRAENDAVGRNTEERQRNLAVRREEERLRGIHPDLPNTEAGRRAIGNAGRIADEQLRGRRLSEIEGYGREAGAIIGKGITDAIRTGSLRGFKEIPGMLWEIMARGLITKPLEEWFSQMARNLFNSGGVFGGGGGGGGMLSGLGSALGIGSLGGIAGTGMLGKSFAEVSFAAIAHDGGMPGQTGAWRAVPASVFHEAPRYHTGRGPGAWIAPQEIATILTRDEVVLNRRQQERAASAMRMGGRPVTVVQNITTRDAGSFDRSQAQNAARARRAFLRTGRSA